MSRINEFLSECGVFFLATEEAGQPHLRPLGAHMEIAGKVCFGVGDFKAVYRQMVANPRVEIAACRGDRHWMRYTGLATFETDGSYAEAMLEANPHLRRIYNEETGHRMMVFHLENATAVEINVMGEGERMDG